MPRRNADPHPVLLWQEEGWRRIVVFYSIHFSSYSMVHTFIFVNSNIPIHLIRFSRQPFPDQCKVWSMWRRGLLAFGCLLLLFVPAPSIIGCSIDHILDLGS